MLRVGRCTYDIKGNRIDPEYPGFKKILVLMRSSPYWEISPYCLKNEKGQIMENIWQFSKVYEKVPKVKEVYSRWDNTVVWEHPEEVHVENGKINSAYKAWRAKGMNHDKAVRYPVSYNYRSKCLYAIKDIKEPNTKLDYIAARKQIYVPEYCSLVKPQIKFKKLKKMLEKGENLLIIEVDGPHQESLPYYMGRYGVDKTFIENNTVLINKDNIKLLLNDPKHNFGHGYCLAMALLNKEKEWLD